MRSLLEKLDRVRNGYSRFQPAPAGAIGHIWRPAPKKIPRDHLTNVRTESRLNVTFNPDAPHALSTGSKEAPHEVWIVKRAIRMLLAAVNGSQKSRDARVVETVGSNALWWLRTNRERPCGTREPQGPFFFRDNLAP